MRHPQQLKTMYHLVGLVPLLTGDRQADDLVTSYVRKCHALVQEVTHTNVWKLGPKQAQERSSQAFTCINYPKGEP